MAPPAIPRQIGVAIRAAFPAKSDGEPGQNQSKFTCGAWYKPAPETSNKYGFVPRPRPASSLNQKHRAAVRRSARPARNKYSAAFPAKIDVEPGQRQSKFTCGA
jgi:hypothetical protein